MGNKLKPKVGEIWETCNRYSFGVSLVLITRDVKAGGTYRHHYVALPIDCEKHLDYLGNDYDYSYLRRELIRRIQEAE